jgi:hypothetical protein
MGLFKQKKNDRKVVPGWHSQASSKCNEIGHRISNYLQELTNRMAPSRLKLIFLVLVALIGGLNTWEIVNAFRHPSTILEVTPIVQPAKLHLTRFPSLDDSLTRVSIERIEQFRRHMDSMREDPERRVVYDSMLQARPGLFDSIAIVERLYRLPLTGN